MKKIVIILVLIIISSCGSLNYVDRETKDLKSNTEIIKKLYPGCNVEQYSRRFSYLFKVYTKHSKTIYVIIDSNKVVTEIDNPQIKN